MTATEVVRLRSAARKWEKKPRRSSRPWDRPRIAASIDVMLGTGLRIGETLALRWEDIDLTADTPTLIVTGTIVRDEHGRLHRQEVGKSAASERTLYLPQFTVVTLTEHREQATEIPESGAVFPTAVGSWLDPDNYRTRFREVRTIAELGWVTPHTLRATVATQVYRAEDLASASQQLGHSEVGVTSRHYVERDRRGPAEVVGVLDDFVSVS
jgi:integrase